MTGGSESVSIIYGPQDGYDTKIRQICFLGKPSKSLSFVTSRGGGCQREGLLRHTIGSRGFDKCQTFF